MSSLSKHLCQGFLLFLSPKEFRNTEVTKKMQPDDPTQTFLSKHSVAMLLSITTQELHTATERVSLPTAGPYNIRLSPF